jgi:hypothetical protein
MHLCIDMASSLPTNWATTTSLMNLLPSRRCCISFFLAANELTTGLSFVGINIDDWCPALHHRSPGNSSATTRTQRMRDSGREISSKAWPLPVVGMQSPCKESFGRRVAHLSGDIQWCRIQSCQLVLQVNNSSQHGDSFQPNKDQNMMIILDR